MLELDEAGSRRPLASGSMVDRVEAATRPVRIGIIGKYVDLPDAYLSVVESLKHAGFHHGAKVRDRVDPGGQGPGPAGQGRPPRLDGMVIPGGFGERGIEGKIAAAGYARENELPAARPVPGLQVMIIDFARNGAAPGRGQLQRSSTRPRRIR